MDIDNLLNSKALKADISPPLEPTQMNHPQLTHSGLYMNDGIKVEGSQAHNPAHHLQNSGQHRSMHNVHHDYSQSTIPTAFGDDLPYGSHSTAHVPSAIVQQHYATAGLRQSENPPADVLAPHTQLRPQAGDASGDGQHVAPKAFACSTCGKGFARRSDLARHERIHSGVRPHFCQFSGCNKKFIQRSALTVHERVHTGHKPHMCEKCGKPFSDSSSLARHRRIHSGNRPYKCPFANCQKTFTRRTTLTRHQNHHIGTVEDAAAARDTALASRPDGQSAGSATSEADNGSEPSSLAASSPSQRTASSVSSASLPHHATGQQQSANYSYAAIPNGPSHLRTELQRPDSITPNLNQSQSHALLSQAGSRSSGNSRNHYGQIPTQLESALQHPNNSDTGSPHTTGWPAHPGAPYAYPEPNYANTPHGIYCHNAAPQRPHQHVNAYEYHQRTGEPLWDTQ